MSKATREKFGLPPLHVSAPAPAAPAAPPVGAVWNGIRRLWMVDGVAVDPQPPPLSKMAQVIDPAATVVLHVDGARHRLEAIPPAVKVSA